MRLNLPTIAAIAAGGLLLTSQMRKRRHHLPHIERRLPHVALNRRGSGPALSLQETLVVRPQAPAVLAAATLAVGGLLAWMKMGSFDGHSIVEESLEMDVPATVAYNQWTQFEEFPEFMASVEEVKQTDDTHLHWRAIIAGKPEEWDAEITEQIPDKRIAWRSTSGVHNAGVVTFHKLSDSRCRVQLQMEYQPQTLGEKLGDALGGVKLTAKGNLKRFKKMVEQRGMETGGWRGTVAQH